MFGFISDNNHYFAGLNPQGNISLFSFFSLVVSLSAVFTDNSLFSKSGFSCNLPQYDKRLDVTLLQYVLYV